MIYVSYSQKDKPFVNWVCRNLTKKGLHLLADSEQLAGADYAQELTKRIDAAEAIIFFYSDNTENSTWVKREIEFSISRKKTIIPVLLTQPDESGWLHFNLGSINWISIDENSIEELTEKILSAFNAAHKRDEKTTHTKDYGEENILPNAKPSSPFPKSSYSFRPKAIGCGCLMILILIITIIYFTFFKLSSTSEPPQSIDAFPNQDSLIVNQRKDELKMAVNNQLRELLLEISEPSIAMGNGSSYPSHLKEIEYLLGVDSIPFSKDSINTRQDLLKAFDDYQKRVNIILEKRLAEIDEAHNTPIPDDNDSISVAHNQGEEDLTPLSGHPNIWLCAILSFLAGAGLMVILQRIKKYKRNNLKLSSNITSVVSIDGNLQKEILPREVYKTHLDKGEYLIDFEDKQNSERHKTFNHIVDSNESKLLFAEFESLSLDRGKSIKCFIAGSKSLQSERDALRAVTCVMYNKWAAKNFRILSYTFEDFERAVVIGGHQKQYNDFILKEADWALFIIDGKIGGITIEEYRIAMDSYKKNGRPKILAFAKTGSEDNKDIATIKEEINKEHQYWTDYTDINSLKLLFESTLNWDLINIFQ